VLDEWVGLGNLSAGWWLIQQVVAPLVALDRLTYAAVLAGAVEARTDALPVFAADTDRLRSAIATVCERLGDTAARAALERGATWPTRTFSLAHAALDPNRLRHR